MSQKLPKFEKVQNVTKKFQKLQKRKHEITKLNKIWTQFCTILSRSWTNSFASNEYRSYLERHMAELQNISGRANIPLNPFTAENAHIDKATTTLT
jgi:hypothetical protein